MTFLNLLGWITIVAFFAGVWLAMAQASTKRVATITLIGAMATTATLVLAVFAICS